VNDGPVRGFAETWFYDSLDVAKHLQPGRNVIAMLAHNPGRGHHRNMLALALRDYPGRQVFQEIVTWSSTLLSLELAISLCLNI
jgi:hypothetical protein